MGTPKPPGVGTIGWHDLTVADAEGVRAFYESVVGWTASPVDMGGYADYTMHPPGVAEPTAGICHARGGNADLPAQWLLYFVVADLGRSVAAVQAGGGEVVVAPRDLAGGRFSVIRDPAGAVCALYQLPEAPAQGAGG